MTTKFRVSFACSYTEVFNTTTGEECTEGFPSIMLQDVQDQKINHFNSTRLIPEMNFTCSGTMTKVTVAGKQQDIMTCGDPTCEPMKLQIWRLENSTVDGAGYQRVGSINLTFNVTMTHSTDNNNTRCTHSVINSRSSV